MRERDTVLACDHHYAGGLHCDTFIFSRQLNNKNRCLPEPHTRRRYLYMQQQKENFLSAHSDLENVIITSYTAVEDAITISPLKIMIIIIISIIIMITFGKNHHHPQSVHLCRECHPKSSLSSSSLTTSIKHHHSTYQL